MYLEDQDCLSRREKKKHFTDGTFLHALCLIFKCALQENIFARGQAPFFGKGKFENFKFIAHSSKDQKMLYMAKNVALSCTTYSVCPNNLRKECPFSRSPAGLRISLNRMRVYMSQLVCPKNLLIYQLRLADASAVCMQHTSSHDWLSATTKLIPCFCVKN